MANNAWRHKQGKLPYDKRGLLCDHGEGERFSWQLYQVINMNGIDRNWDRRSVMVSHAGLRNNQRRLR